MRRKKLRYVRFYLNEWAGITQKFEREPETLGKLFSAAVRYADTGEEPEFPKDSELQSMWLLCRGQIYRDLYYYGRRE